MVVGNGLLGMSFLLSSENDNESRVIFASGVSNSKETDIKEFNREKELILKHIKTDKKFIYFSSILSDIVDNPYYNHKLDMEELVRNNSNNYLIFRVPQIVGYSKNPNTLMNYLIRNIKDSNEVVINEGIKRALIDVTDIIRIVNYCDLKNTCLTLNISFIEKISVISLYQKLTVSLSCEENYSIETTHNDSNWNVDNSPLIIDAINELRFNQLDYTDDLIRKYTR